MAAVLSADMDHTDKVVILIEECKRLGLAVRPPDLNASRYEFAVADDRSIRYGLGAVKGVGEAAVEALIDEREARGPYTSLEDLCRRLDLHESQSARARGADPVRQPRLPGGKPRGADGAPGERHAARRPERTRA